ncbi:acetyl-CoA synthase domain protein [Vibrio parahaemolyticus V-223/04]|nr:acetyl-CoA synthase domain protein [Vibrio parahaemolyticus V-223/04]
MHEAAQVMRLAIMRHYTAGLLNTMTHFGSTLGNFVKSLAS